ncbi:LOW QUALITY PROTEIN: transmembrane protein 135 homolog [Hibiscus syriacus]|uniref:LOW QUALITY PROTEIN: transmembrane protein 135 homolog n=1 Tax=Hibiscus syriacus TaxID=106335 RepID=UPI001920B1A7|nr:LOW QUALITY PROTEIN: transmembrane protein 135 homolog [Hibiscus syriacus]
MSPSADGAINCACRCSTPSGENGGFKDGATPRLVDVDKTCTHCSRSKPSSYSSSTLGFGSIPLTNSEKLRRLVVASAKGFSIGAGLRGGLAFFSILARLRRKSSRKVESMSDKEAIVLGIKETIRYGLFLGTFSGTFVSVDEIIVALGGHNRTAKWRALIAGLVAGPSMLLTGLNTQHKSLAIYILMRAAVLASRCGIKSKRFGKLCKPLTWEHGDIFLMCLASSQILSSYLLKPESFPPSYRSFLNKHVGKDLVILQGVKEHASGLPYTNLEGIEEFYKAKGAAVKLDPNMKIPCSMIHGNQACSSHVFTFFREAYKRSLPVYLPVYLIPTLLVHRQGLLRRPYTILGKSLLGTARSSLFLSAYTSSAWMWTCTMNRLFGKCDIPIVALGTFPTGLALAVEKKSRRMEISLYCLARAIESFFTCMADVGYLPKSMNLKRADVVIFSLSTAIIMHCYAQEREVFRSKYLSVLDWVFGVPPPPCEDSCCKNR